MKRITDKQRTDRFRVHKRRLRSLRGRKAARIAKAKGIETRRKFARSNGIAFDANLKRRQIVVPANLSLSANREDVLDVLSQIRANTDEARRPAMIHLNHVAEVEPAAALALVAEIDRARRRLGPKGVTGTYPTNEAAMYALSGMGFFGILSILAVEQDPSKVPGQPVFFPFKSGTTVDRRLIDAFVSLVEKHLFPIAPLDRVRLIGAIGEAMQNTIDHAHPSVTSVRSSARRWWMSCRFDVARCEVSFVFFDQGVGIPQTLGVRRYEQVLALVKNVLSLKLSTTPTDGEMIAAATETHRTGTEDERRGLGFLDMKTFIDTCTEGEMRVLSKRGKYHYMGRDNEFLDNSRGSLEGTIIEWRFRNSRAPETG